MTAKDKITKAKIQLILNEPFFATLLLSIPLLEDATTKTIITNGLQIRYNPEFVGKISVDEIAALLCHEILHITNFHATRRQGRNAQQWNQACDYAINPLLKDCGFLPKGCKVANEYNNMHAEKIFSMLPAPSEQKEPAPGEVEDSPAKTESEREQQEAEIKQKIIQATNAAKKQAGTMPASLKRMIEETLQPIIHWQEILARFICDVSRNDYSFKKPNARFIHSGFYLPSLYNEEPGKIALIVDTSMSIDKQLLAQFGSEIQDICANIGHSLTVIYVDTEVQGTQEIDPDSPAELKPIGGGGTDFKPGFEYIEKEEMELKAAVYFTDGICRSYPTEPPYPVLWAQYGDYDFSPPFGEVIKF